MEARFAIGRAAVSTHITQLEDARVLVRELDRTVRLIDAHGIQVLIVEGHRVASTADAGAAIVTEALRVNLEERLQHREGPRPDIAAFFASHPPGATFDTDGLIQRPEALDAPQARALSKDRWRLKIYWVRTRPPGPEGELPRPSMPAFYHPPPAHIVIINADWVPLARVVARQAASRPSAEIWEATYPLVEREVADALGAAVRRKGIDAGGLNDVLHELIVDCLPIVEQRLRNTLQRRESRSS